VIADLCVFQIIILYLQAGAAFSVQFVHVVLGLFTVQLYTKVQL